MSAPDPTADRQASWSRYWASGALHSCPGSFRGNYDGALAGFWQRRFADVGVGQRVLEIGAGNGALAQLFLRATAASGTCASLDAVDLARVAPDWLRRRPPAEQARVRFHAGVRAEQLPFPEQHFDVVLSQYGFEYADRVAASAELLRVLAPAGRACLVMHHADSRIVEVAREECAHMASVDGPGGLLECAAVILPYLSMAASDSGRRALREDPAADAARHGLNSAMQGLQQRVDASRYPDLLLELRTALVAVFQRAGSGAEEAARTQLDALVAGLRDSALRQREVVGCALDAAAIAGLAALLADGGRREFVSGLVHHEAGHLLGWSVQLGPRRD